MPSKPALRTELLFYLSFLAAAALLVGVATMVVVTVLAPQRTFVLLLLLVGLEVGAFVVFGGSLVQRLVLRPLARVVATADAVAGGALAPRAPAGAGHGEVGPQCPRRRGGRRRHAERARLGLPPPALGPDARHVPAAGALRPRGGPPGGAAGVRARPAWCAGGRRRLGAGS